MFKFLNTILFLVILSISAPTLLFLTKSYYHRIFAKKTYVGVIELPPFIEKSEEIIASTKSLFESNNVMAVIINCNGNGGLPGPIQSIYNDLVRLKDIYKKPLISFIEKTSLAGSYFIATASDVIIASEGAIIGKLENYYTDENAKLIQDSTLHNEYKSLFQKNLSLSRPKFLQKNVMQNYVTGQDLINNLLVDNLGGNMEIEKILKTKIVIEGTMEKVHGSFIEYCLFYISDLVHRTINYFKIN